jgi:hypothetical protein
MGEEVFISLGWSSIFISALLWFWKEVDDDDEAEVYYAH